MKTFTAADFDPEAVVRELLDGSGAVRLPKLFSDEQVKEARDIVVAETDDANFTGSHFNQDEKDAKLQRRVWNLLKKGDVFARMAVHPQIFDTMQVMLGTDFTMGSICASRLMPGFGGQEPHIDYPYWDYDWQKRFPTRINASFPMNCQATVLLDPFTEENGATGYRPGTQKVLQYPDAEDFLSDHERMLGDPGDVVLFFGLVWHCGMPNRSDESRTGILIEYLPKFVKPIEDMLRDLDDGFLEAADPKIRQLLGLMHPWPSQPPADKIVG